MWDFFETVRHRHSVRKYQTDIAIEDSKLHAILEMACAAPSAGDMQSYQIIVVKNRDKRNALRMASDNQEFISEAPVCMIFCADPQRSAKQFGERGELLYAIQDATIAASYAQLAIVAAGMGSTWIGNFNDTEVATVLNIGNDLIPVAMLSVGYPAELPEQTSRRKLDDVVRYIE